MCFWTRKGLGGLEIFHAVDYGFWVYFSWIWEPIKIHPKSENVKKFKLLTSSHRIFVIFNYFGVRSLDFWDNFWPDPKRIFDGFYLFTSLDTLFQLTTNHSPFQTRAFRPSILLFNPHVSHPTVERIISLKSCQSQANLSFWMSHFHSNSSAKKHN